jgi:hypothetical protein
MGASVLTSGVDLSLQGVLAQPLRETDKLGYATGDSMVHILGVHMSVGERASRQQHGQLDRLHTDDLHVKEPLGLLHVRLAPFSRLNLGDDVALGEAQRQSDDGEEDGRRDLAIHEILQKGGFVEE